MVTGKFLIPAFVALSYIGWAQDSLTTFILVRHAEKDMTQSTPDPDLSDAGKQRANRLAEILQKTEIAAIYSTEYKRTRQTVEPLAAHKNLTIQTYMAGQDKDIDAMISNNPRGIIVVAGHSNTIPQFANYLLGEQRFNTIEDSEFNNLLILSLNGKRK